MTHLKAVIVDDEELARKEFRELLREFSFINVAGEAEDADSAKILINEIEPDVIFLDIQMPGKTGFDLVSEIDTKAKIIFVTAFDEFALRAFEVNALDYLMKPVYPARLRETIERLISNEPAEHHHEPRLEPDDYIFFRMKDRSKFIRLDTIICINSSREYTEIITTGGIKGLIYKPMLEWEKRLPEKIFLRIHRSTIINLKFVEHLKPSLNNTYKVYMKGLSEPLVLSRRYAAKLKNLFF